MMRRWLLAVVGAAVLGGVLDARAQVEEVMMDPREPRVGDIVRVSLRLPTGVKAGEMTFAGKTVPGFETGGLLNAYIGIDLDTKPGEHAVGYAMGSAKGAIPLTVAARTFETESLKVAPKYTKLDKPTQARVDREAKELNAIWQRITKERLWTKSFVRPAMGELGSSFGLRRVFNDEPKSPHAGLDIKAPTGTEVYAANQGTIALARELFYTGNTVVIDHGLGLYTIYAHLSRIDVEAGKPVERAQRVGLVGATGRVTGPHLHWGVKLLGARVDPATLPGMSL
jgi:murein DD-endopeptidase MepM/ murein hydrolase activator NlpD